MSAFRIHLHPAKARDLKKGESFEIDSGLGGTFSASFQHYREGKAHFIITSSSPPPEGWRGEERVFKAEDLEESLFLVGLYNYFTKEETIQKHLTRLGHDPALAPLIKKRFYRLPDHTYLADLESLVNPNRHASPAHS